MGRFKFSKDEKSWILYDVANSAFILMQTAVIPVFFHNLAINAGVEKNDATAFWGFAVSAATLVLIVLSPILGAIADYKGFKKRLFGVSLCLGLAGALSLGLVGNWAAYLAVFIIARLGYSACNVFYDSMLVDVTDDNRMDRVSASGFAWGYIGSCIPFILNIAIILVKPFGITTTFATQIALCITALWWGVLSLPLLKNVHQNYYLENRTGKVKDAFFRLAETTVGIIKNKGNLFYFLLAYFCYIDGVYTIINMATIYGAEVGIDQSNMILALLLTQFVAFPCAILTGRLAGKIHPVKLLKFFIVIYTGVTLFGVQLDKQWEFWFLAVVVGLAQGGIQTISRSYFGKLVPKERSNEYFGFFDIFGKSADFLGPVLMGLVSLITGKSNYGILSLVLLFVAGYLLLSKIPTSGQKAA